MIDDFLFRYISPDYVREWSVVSNFVAAFFVGPYLAFAATPDAGFKCLQAFVRLVHRVFLVLFAIALMNNAMVILQTNRTPTGSGLILNVLILATVVCSAIRYHWWMADIPKGASWKKPHFVHRQTNAERSDSTR